MGVLEIGDKRDEQVEARGWRRDTVCGSAHRCIARDVHEHHRDRVANCRSGLSARQNDPIVRALLGGLKRRIEADADQFNGVGQSVHGISLHRPHYLRCRGPS